MRLKTVNILQNPFNGEKLSLTEKDTKQILHDLKGNEFYINDGIPNFLRPEDLCGDNGKYEKFYNRVGYIAGLFEGLMSKFFDFDEMRKEWLQDIEIKPGSKVLEVSIGNGWNLRKFPKDTTFYGLDISKGMLHQCKKNFKSWDINADLFLGSAEYLPFKDGVFDVIFHIGGINFFNDKKRALNEMYRVAKPGTKIIIIDETDKDIKEKYQKIPIIRRLFKDRDVDGKTKPPLEFIPEGASHVELKLIDNESMYQLSFVKDKNDF